MFSQTDLYICASAFLLLSFAYVVALCFVCFLTDDLSSKRDFVLTKKRNKMANKSDELATKEMPFRCYVGYDSHEDITFEVSLRVFVSCSVSFFASLGGGGGGGGGVARSVVIPPIGCLSRK